MSARLLLSALLGFPVLAVAETTRPAYTPPTVLSSGSMLQVIFSLLLVLGAVVLIAWVLKRISQPLQGAGRQLKVISGVAVGQRERVVVVEINDTWLILGVAQGNVRTLHTMPKSELPPESHVSDANDGKFQLWLKQVMEKRNAT
ncbi:MAG: flagellar biosynthetic protein FliO [Sideroxydans sp.]|nr:flagellar biosynthetic protein FliO [Sideroxydans sp.]